MDDRLHQAVALLTSPGQVVEVRALTDQYIHSGYFLDHTELVRQVAALDTDPTVQGIYLTLNEVNPALLSRRANRIKMRLGKKDATTSDNDILRRRWFPIDIDPIRPSGVSSNTEEHERALQKADVIASWLQTMGFPYPLKADSGNGAHLLYRVDLPNDAESTTLIKRSLEVLDALFTDGQVSVDTANHNAARIWKLYGTVSRKGDNTPDRPHRQSRILSVPAQMEVVKPDLLQQLMSIISCAPPETKGYKSVFNLSDWLNNHGIKIISEKPYQGGSLFNLATCPFSTDHSDGAFAIQFPNGAIHAGCLHARCGGGRQRWQELRARFEPDRSERNKQYEERITEGRRERIKAKADAKRTGDGNPAPATRPSLTGEGSAHEYPMTDAGNAERLIARYGETIRYCATFNAWYIWNGRTWERDDSRQMLDLATQVARSIYAEATGATTPDRAKALARWAIVSEGLRMRKAMIESATPYMPIRPDEFDAVPNLFNCRNGTLELDTMSFREHCLGDMLTKIANVSYESSADCPLWRAHLELIFEGDADSITGFQSICGYSLLQDNPEQVMFILFGRGRNGKSKTIEVQATIMGDYAVNIAAESLMVHRNESARSDLARMAGARMATASEGEDGARLAESIIKQLTGEYAITVRRLYENEFEFTPTAKIWLTTNHEPVIRGTDDGIWRRIWMVPFTVQIPEGRRDPDIVKKLLMESSGILNWCLEGLKRYYANGSRLVKPHKVSVATGNYRTVSDTIGLFLLTECVMEPGRKISRLAFREMFLKWCEEEGIRHPISARKLALTLKAHGVIDGGKSGNERFWSGIRWKTEAEREVCEHEGGVQDSLFGIHQAS